MLPEQQQREVVTLMGGLALLQSPPPRMRRASTTSARTSALTRAHSRPGEGLRAPCALRNPASYLHPPRARELRIQNVQPARDTSRHGLARPSPRPEASRPPKIWHSALQPRAPVSVVPMR